MTMNHQNNNRNDSRSDNYGRRYRSDGYSDRSSRYIDNFDQDETAYQSRRPSRQNAYDSSRQPYPQSYDNRGYQQAPSRRQGYDRQQYPQRQGYPRQQYPQQQRYDNRGYRADYDNGYGDDYNRGSRQRRPVNQDDYRRGSNGRRPVNRSDRPRGKRPKQRTSTGIIVVRVIAFIMLLVGAFIIGTKLYHYYSDKKGHMELQQLSSNYEELYNKNHDFFGWLIIDDTVIDYPVMHTPNDPEKYLHKNFDGENSESGELFMDAACDPNGYHYLIYGHHMFNGSMFGGLPKYGDQEYYNAHRTINFNTRFEKGEYEIFAVFYSQVFDENTNTFKYYECQNLNDEASYNSYVQNVKTLSTYDTGITPQYGEKIITLSTCNYHTQDGRFVVCARKK